VRATAVFIVALAVAPIGWIAPVGAVEQTIVPLTRPGSEQTIQHLGQDESAQHVETVAEADQVVGPQVPPSPAAKAASTAGKAVLGVFAAVLALGMTAASLLLI